jgi:phage terminase Nu1 subunit (DNA packaging protein)
VASRGLSVSKKQCCDILGWTSSEFDRAVREGMPVAERPSGRGTDYVVFMGDVIRWLVKQELQAAGHEDGRTLPALRRPCRSSRLRQRYLALPCQVQPSLPYLQQLSGNGPTKLSH